MIDKKVYKDDYESEFTGFFKSLSIDNSKSKGVNTEINTYSVINKLRDNADIADSRNKLWEDF